mmetsp:Transcript_23859/g.68533  ORF Transcript_23859/g.68533 Transcript_23859/m.68533 type:complete len:245 (+) Transcript_23859:753-1487(+)
MNWNLGYHCWFSRTPPSYRSSRLSSSLEPLARQLNCKKKTKRCPRYHCCCHRQWVRPLCTRCPRGGIPSDETWPSSRPPPFASGPIRQIASYLRHYCCHRPPRPRCCCFLLYSFWLRHHRHMSNMPPGAIESSSDDPASRLCLLPRRYQNRYQNPLQEYICKVPNAHELRSICLPSPIPASWRNASHQRSELSPSRRPWTMLTAWIRPHGPRWGESDPHTSTAENAGAKSYCTSPKDRLGRPRE